MLKFILIAALLSRESVLGVEVDLELGRVHGVTLNSRLGVSFHAFRGIRYAEPPVAALRFVNPKPVKAWAPATFDATEDGPICPQPWDNTIVVSEDCLRLNVYTKNLNESARLPVIVFLHPGGFYALSGISKHIAGPENLMDRECVLVTLNYRLGTLGFLATNSADAPGNAGLKDQVMALRWIQQHIHRFGGDPKSVTLLGNSAGSWSIGLHMVSPMSRGLFHRGICMSASPYGHVPYVKDDVQVAQRQARLLKCPETPVKDLVNCMREKPMQDFVDTLVGMFDFGWHPVLNWHPVIEQDFGQERFLLENPFKTVQSGNFSKVPIITGITELEFLSGALDDIRNDTTLNNLNNEWEQMAPIALLYEQNTSNSREASRVLRKEYLGTGPIENPESLHGLERLYSDALIGFAYHRFKHLMSTQMAVYTYYFRYKGRYSFAKDPDTNQTYGAVHNDELLYLFQVPIVAPLFKQSDPENVLIERMTRMWTEFAKKGNPNNVNDEYLRDLQWPLFNPQDPKYLEIDVNLMTKCGDINEKRYLIWEELFPLPKF